VSSEQKESGHFVSENLPFRYLLLALGQLLLCFIQSVIGIFQQLFGEFEIMNSISLFHDIEIELRITVQLAIDKGMASADLNPVNLRLDLLHLFLGLSEQLLRLRFPLVSHAGVTLIVTFHATLLDGVEGIHLLSSHPRVAVHTLHLA